MGWKDLFVKKESLISIDIGSSGIKLLELDMTGEKPSLVNLGMVPLTGEVFANNVITKTEKVSEQIASLLETNAITDKRVVVAIPGPSVFTKKIKMAKMSPAELHTNIYFEAGNFIPHNIDAVRMDYHVLGESGKNQLDVLVVAVKNEIIDSFLNTMSMSGLETAVVDVDYFALQNMFELCYPELKSKTIALINIGARYSSINICRNGDSLFTGDIVVGGRLFTEAIAESTGLSVDEAEKLKKKGATAKTPDIETMQDVIDKKVEYVASEFNRQLSFFWNASGSDEGIDQILLTGGGSQIPGLVEELSEKTGIECSIINPFKGVHCGETFDKAYIAEMGPLMSINVGLAIRQPGDKINSEWE
jgi:type IV pilus assembly protein PilM